jgi:3',5'-cyclic AMP phosphodiesterase CpdA
MMGWKDLEEGEIAIAHLSDLHFGSHEWTGSWELVTQCLLDEIRPSLLLVTGDLADTPATDLYEKARDELGRIAAALSMGHGHVDYYVCPGNHDRFRKGNRSSLRRIVGDATVRPLITACQVFGACVAALLWWLGLPLVSLCLALLLLAIALLLPLSWVLDRLWASGNQDARFYEIFGANVVSPKQAKEVTLGSGASKWLLGLLGVDSSVNADTSARGFVKEEVFHNFVETTRGQGAKKWDLCIFLVHHHVLPVRQLEAKRQKHLADLLNLTCLVNAGCLLESLADAHVDLVLHGHEHEHNWGSYGSFSSGSSPIRVVGAGSATGNNARTGCSVNDATFNVIILAPSGSGKLRRLKYHGSDWKVEDDLPLFSASDVRSSRAHRAKGRPADEINGEITKYVQFTRTRDIEVYLVFRNWALSAEFNREIWNSTGVVDAKDVAVRLQGKDVPAHEPKATLEKAGDHRWTIKFPIPLSHRNTPLTVEIRYTWRGGGTLTDAELQQIQARPAPGQYRGDGLEFATIWTDSPAASAELFLQLPPEYAPDNVHVRVKDEAGYPCEPEAAEVSSRCLPLSVGVFVFRIPFPRINYHYALVWKPGSAEDENSPTETLLTVAQARGNELLQIFASVFKETSWWGRMTLALYLKSGRPLEAVRVATIAPGSRTVPGTPTRIPLVGDDSLMVQAWWGIPHMAPRRLNEGYEAQIGFVDGETVLICLPLRFGFDWTNPSPWGVVRISLMEPDAQEFEFMNDDESLWRVLSVATMKMLAQALTTTLVDVAPPE